MKSLDAAGPSSQNFLMINKPQSLANPGNIQLNTAETAVAQQHIQQLYRMQQLWSF